MVKTKKLHKFLSPYSQKVACAARLVICRRITDFQLRDHILLFYLMEGGPGIRDHNGTLYLYNKGAWSTSAGLISDALLGPSKAFLLEVEWLVRALLPTTKRNEVDMIAAVLQVFCDQGHASEEDLSRTPHQNCVRGHRTSISSF